MPQQQLHIRHEVLDPPPTETQTRASAKTPDKSDRLKALLAVVLLLIAGTVFAIQLWPEKDVADSSVATDAQASTGTPAPTPAQPADSSPPTPSYEGPPTARIAPQN